MERTARKNRPICGTCSHWGGDVEVISSTQVRMKSSDAKCDKKHTTYGNSSNFGCSDWEQRFK